jgi:DNA repair protein RadA/Sms
MAKSKEAYICQNCGASSPKWQGQCAACDFVAFPQVAQA